MTMTVDLGSGKSALIDAADAHLLGSRTWRSYKGRRDKTFYARAHTCHGKTPDGKHKKVTLLLHRVIMGAKTGEIVDHENGDGLDCRRNNLRKVTPSQSAMNKCDGPIGRNPYKGVTMHRGKWRARITTDGDQKVIGYFNTDIEAAVAYNFAALVYHGDYARLNAIDYGER